MSTFTKNSITRNKIIEMIATCPKSTKDRFGPCGPLGVNNASSCESYGDQGKFQSGGACVWASPYDSQSGDAKGWALP